MQLTSLHWCMAVKRPYGYTVFKNAMNATCRSLLLSAIVSIRELHWDTWSFLTYNWSVFPYLLSIKFWSAIHDWEFSSCSFVREFVNSSGVPLPYYTSGKLLQELLGSIPNVSLVGGRPSTISVVLSPRGAPQSMPPAQAPQNLSGISASFLNLLMHSPYFELPFRWAVLVCAGKSVCSDHPSWVDWPTGFTTVSLH